MTPLMLQSDLVTEIEDILKDVITKNTAGETVTGIKGYEYRLPIIESDEEDESQFFPYFIVRTSEGRTEDDDSPWLVTVDIILGICENDKDAPGHKNILVMIQRITDRFASEPLLNGKYRAEQNMEWAVQDEDTYPFYFGGVEIKFRVPKIGRRIPNYDC
ncbi:hypothetical protein OCV99_03695 [Dorea acetigenes]|uniref:Tail terminator n=1 Tax=Dorea acetigenes TaxID=2981787 RepID=A0ABT2RKG5_9FIRM|nr:hypothetical protein [Dorea acetigenes]MCU6685669.1 hypothetical protein [Dorea acetigenes]SCI58987.1 Uncharacterised protein [uncultured Clostridium sp.]